MGFEDTITLFDGSSVAVSKATGRPGPGEGENPSAMAGWGLKALANAVNTLATGLPGGTTAATAGTLWRRMPRRRPAWMSRRPPALPCPTRPARAMAETAVADLE